MKNSNDTIGNRTRDIPAYSVVPTPPCAPNQGRSKRFFYAPKRSDRLWDLPSLLFNNYRVSFLGIRRSGREVGHSPPSSTKVKNVLIYASTPPTCLQGVDSENLPLPYVDYKTTL